MESWSSLGDVRIHEQCVLSGGIRLRGGINVDIYAKVYQHTHDPKYLTTARRMAEYFVRNIPSDGIVPWYINFLMFSQSFDFHQLFCSGTSTRRSPRLVRQTPQRPR